VLVGGDSEDSLGGGDGDDVPHDMPSRAAAGIPHEAPDNESPDLR
jgi:hypothetical protein